MLLILLSLILQVPDEDYNLTDFRLPESGAMRLWADAGGNLDSYYGVSDIDDSFYTNPDIHTGSKWERGYAKVYNTWVRSSEQNDYNLGVSLGFFSNGGNQLDISLADSSIFDTVTTLDNSYADFNLNFSFNEDWLFYPFKKVFLFGLSGFSRLSYQGLEEHDYITYYYYDSWEKAEVLRDDFSTDLSVDFLVGVGRLRPLEYPSRAIVMAEILEEEGICDPDPVMVAELAELFARRWEYPLKYWHPDWEFYEDAEKLLEEYGVERGNVNVRNWMRIIEASSVWEKNWFWGDGYSFGRPYGIRVTMKPLFFDVNYNWGRGHYSNEYWSSGFPDSQWDSMRGNTEFSTSFVFRPLVVALEGGYPLSNTMHIYGDVDFSVSPFYYSIARYRSEYWSESFGDTIETVQDTTIIENEFNPRSYAVSCDLRLRKHIIYDLSIITSYTGNLGRIMDYYYGLDYVNSYWYNTLSVGGEYYFFNRFAFSVSGSFNVAYNYRYYEYYMRNYTDWDVGSGISARVSYRFF